MCAIGYWCHMAPKLKLPLESSKERVSIFINRGFTFSEKQGPSQPVQESRDSKSGQQRETEFDVSQALVFQQEMSKA